MTGPRIRPAPPAETNFDSACVRPAAPLGAPGCPAPACRRYCQDMPTRQRTGRGRIVCVSAYPGTPLGYIRHITQPRAGLRIVARGSYGHLRRTGRPRTARPGQAVMPR